MRSLSQAVRRLGLICMAASLSAGGAPAGEVLPCGVADAGNRTGFVANARGGIDAVDLATGDLLWDVAGASRPALAEDDRLFAWTPVKGNGLRVLAFDRTHAGRRLLESEAVVFPDWVSVEEVAGRSFTARWRLDKDRLILDWEARAWYAGAHSTPRIEAEARRYAEGRVTIDAESGKAETAEVEKRTAPPRAPKELETALVRWRGAAGGLQAALVLEEVDGRQRLLLWSWDAEKVHEPKELCAGARLLALSTVDDRILCVRDAAASSDPGPDERRKSDWSVFAVNGGERLAQVPYEPGTEAMAVVGPRVLCLVAGPHKGSIDKPFVRARSLKAFDLKTGKPLWDRPIEGKLISPPGP